MFPYIYMEWISFRLLLRNAICVYNYKYKTLPQYCTVVNTRIFYYTTRLHIIICMIYNK